MTPLREAAPWALGERLLAALTDRDFDRLADCLAPDATMRALLPSGPALFDGPQEIVATFRRWLADAEGYQVLAGQVSAVGERVHVSWRLRLHPTPRGGEGWHLLEQQAYVDAAEQISRIDLLCTGFLREAGAA